MNYHDNENENKTHISFRIDRVNDNLMTEFLIYEIIIPIFH